jgi:penicillin-binding protein 1C
MLELASLYAMLPNGGVKKEPRFLLNSGGAEYAHNAAGGVKRLITPAAAAITLKMLERNPAPDDIRAGAGRAVPIAYKTGTSIGFKDAWSAAVFDRYVLCVWLGNFSGEGNSAFIGRLSAAPLQFSIADALLAEIPPGKLLPPRSLPPEVSVVDVCAVSGDIPGDNCPDLTQTYFIPGVSPITRCRIHRKVYIDTRTGYRTDETEGPHIRAEVREFWPTDLLEIFALAGLPRLSPPPYPPDKTAPAGEAARGFPPSIVSPLSNTTYIMRSAESEGRNSRYNQLVLLAGADQDSGELFWFANAMFLGRSKPNERLTWTPDAGQWDLIVVDSLGRSSGLRLRVESQGF